MARINITVPDEIAERARAAGLNVSREATKALVVELDRLDQIAGLDEYLERCEAEFGPIPDDERLAAVEWADRVLGGSGTAACRSA